MKLSAGNRVLPGRKQVFRIETDGIAAGDVIGRADEELPGTPLLRPVMRAGARFANSRDSLDEVRWRSAEAISHLPKQVRSIEPAERPYRVSISEALLQYEREVRQVVGTKAMAG